MIHRKNGVLHAENVSLDAIAKQFGTPCYVYSRALLEAGYAAYDQALQGRDAMICYAVKANSNLAILNLFARLGAGFDIVSGGELARVLAAGGDAGKIVFSGVGKSSSEILEALAAGIYCFNVESSAELERLNSLAQQCGKRAPMALRVNPHVDAQTHPYIATGLKNSKFGIAHQQAATLYRQAQQMPGIEICGIACHIGSQLMNPAPTLQAAERLLELADELAQLGIVLKHIDLGGGLGVRYHDEEPPPLEKFLHPILQVLAKRTERLLLEPGRSLVGAAGLLLTRVEYLKHGEEHNFALVDAAMNDLMRPALYKAWHDIVPVQLPTEAAHLPTQIYDVAGPVCESSDVLASQRTLALTAGDTLAIMTAGAYGMTMSSNYNSRPRAAEVLVDGDAVHLIRKRETIEQLFADELLPWGRTSWTSI